VRQAVEVTCFSYVDSVFAVVNADGIVNTVFGSCRLLHVGDEVCEEKLGLPLRFTLEVHLR
jgi:hypothetical protein